MTDFLIWRNEWDTGILDIDRQHIEIANQLNIIADEVNKPDIESRRVLAESMLDDLLDMTRQHFKYEEQLMLQSNYPDYKTHNKEHIMLIAELIDHIRDIKQQKLKLDTVSLQALKNWFVAHIVVSDREFANYLCKTNQI